MDFINLIVSVCNVTKVVKRVIIHLQTVRVVIVPILNINIFKNINVNLIVLLIILNKDWIVFSALKTAQHVTDKETEIVRVVHRDYYILRQRKVVALIVLMHILRVVITVYNAIHHVEHALANPIITVLRAIVIKIFTPKTIPVLYAQLDIIIKVLSV